MVRAFFGLSTITRRTMARRLVAAPGKVCQHLRQHERRLIRLALRLIDLALTVAPPRRRRHAETLAEGAREAWTEASEMALRFQNIREATRVAMRLPARSRAFALPLYAEA